MTILFAKGSIFGMANTSQQEQIIRDKFLGLTQYLNERSRRVWAALEARARGFGGVTMVARATGIHRDTITAGLEELKPHEAVPLDRIRKPGAGRRRLTDKDPTLQTDLDALINPVPRGDPESALRWTSKSTQKLAAELRVRGHTISAHKVGELLREAGYSLQSHRKVTEGTADHPDRDAQFPGIADQTAAFQAAHQPVISVDAKKKELVGDFKNGGQEWLPQGEPEAVHVYDFPSLAIGQATPYGVYDIPQ